MADESDARDLALRALDMTAQARQLMEHDEARVIRPSFTELYQYAHGQRVDAWDDFSDVMYKFPDAAADFEHLLDKIALATLPQLAAAAGETIRRREHDGYVLTVSESLAESNQVYLSIETSIDLIDQPTCLFLKMKDDRWYDLIIPLMTNGRAQWVFEKDDPALHAFGQPDTVIYIR